MLITNEYITRHFKDVISHYNNDVPFVVAEYLIYLYANTGRIVCNKHLSFKFLFKPFLKFKTRTTYQFYLIESSNSIPYIKLRGIKIRNLSDVEVDGFSFDDLTIINGFFDEVTWDDTLAPDEDYKIITDLNITI